MFMIILSLTFHNQVTIGQGSSLNVCLKELFMNMRYASKIAGGFSHEKSGPHAKPRPEAESGQDAEPGLYAESRQDAGRGSDIWPRPDVGARHRAGADNRARD